MQSYVSAFFCVNDVNISLAATVPRVPGWDVDDQIQRALEGLRLRSGCCSFLSEPVVKHARSGPKFSKMDVSALEQLI